MAHEFFCRVYYEDTDLGGFVYHANYLRFVERARTEALTERGIDQRVLRAESGILFVVRRMECDFLAPAYLLDRLRVTTTTLAIGGASADLDQAVWRDDACLFRARVVVVAIGANGRPTRIPDAARAVLGGLEGPGDTAV